MDFDETPLEVQRWFLDGNNIDPNRAQKATLQLRYCLYCSSKTRACSMSTFFRMRWLIRPIMSLAILELGLSFVPVPDWWEAVFYEYLYSSRIQRVLSMPKSTIHSAIAMIRGQWTEKNWFLGDSRTYGLFVSQPQTYSQQVELLSDWEGMNLGLPGATSFEGLDSMVPDALQFNPKAAVICLDINRSLMSYVQRNSASGRDAIVSNLLRSSSTWMFIEGGWHSLFSERAPVIPLDEYKRQLTTIFETLSANGVEQNILLVGWTPLQDYPDLFTQQEYDRYREVSREVARSKSIPILEFTDVLRGLTIEQACR